MSHIIKAITKEVQDKLTPMLVLEDFIEGNSRFIANKANTADHKALISIVLLDLHFYLLN